MMGDEGNFDEVNRWLVAWQQTVNFKLAGAGQGLGLDIVHAIGDGIAARAAVCQDADGSPWAPNSTKPSKWYPDGYAAWKEEKYGWVDQPGHRTGQTWSGPNLYGLDGNTTIDTHEIIMRGGLDSPPTTSSAPSGLLSEQDEKVTGLQKLTWAHEATANKPARPGYAYAPEDVTQVLAICTDYVSAHVITTNAG